MPAHQARKKRKSNKKRPRTRTRLSVAERRKQLLELGMRAFTSQPYDAVSIDAIAEQAGVSRGLVFHYFATKHDYYLAVLGGAAEMLLRTSVDAMPAGPPAERLEAGLHAYFQFVGEHAATYAALLRGGVGSDPLVQELVERTRHQFVDTIRANVEEIVPTIAPAQLRSALRGWIGLVEAIALDWIDHRDLTRDQLVATALRAIALVSPDPRLAAVFDGDL